MGHFPGCAHPRHQTRGHDALWPPDPDIECWGSLPVSSHHDAPAGHAPTGSPTSPALTKHGLPVYDDITGLPGIPLTSETQEDTRAPLHGPHDTRDRLEPRSLEVVALYEGNLSRGWQAAGHRPESEGICPPFGGQSLSGKRPG